MKIVSIDIETTGLHRHLGHGIIEFAAVLDDTKNWYDKKKNNNDPKSYLPMFHCYIVDPNRKWSKELLTNPKFENHQLMVKRIKNREEGYDYFAPEEMVKKFAEFLMANGYKMSNDSRFLGKILINPLGKNFGSFDMQWLERVPTWNDFFVLNPRSVDPGMLYLTPTSDRVVPSMQKCFGLAGIDDIVDHTALSDAYYTLLVVRKKYLEKPFLTVPQTMKNVKSYLQYVFENSNLISDEESDKLSEVIKLLK